MAKLFNFLWAILTLVLLYEWVMHRKQLDTINARLQKVEYTVAYLDLLQSRSHDVPNTNTVNWDSIQSVK